MDLFSALQYLRHLCSHPETRERVADLLNGFVYHGKELVRPERVRTSRNVLSRKEQQAQVQEAESGCWSDRKVSGRRRKKNLSQTDIRRRREYSLGAV